MNFKVIILAGGKAERFWPLSDKALFPFLGKPLIEYQIKKIKGVGLKDLIVVGNQENLSTIKKYGVKAVLQKGKGQSAAILSAQKFLRGPVLVVNTNDLFDSSLFKKICLASKEKDVDACLVGVKTSSYFPGGYLVVDKKGRIRKIVEKPGEGKEPSDLVRIVVDFFKKGEKLVQYAKKRVLYEDAIQAMIDDGTVVTVVPYEGEWGYLKYPWHALEIMDYFLTRIKAKKIGKNVKISKQAVISGRVIIKDNVKIFENAKIIGPTYIGKNTIIGNNTMVRCSTIEANCVIGFSTEITRSYVGEGCWFHSNYIGDSVLDKNVSLGAGVVLANLRLDEGNIGSVVQKARVDTKRQKLGSVIGQNVRIGVSSSIMPGVKIGKNSFIGAGVVLEKDLEESKFCCLENHNLKITKNLRRVKLEERVKLKTKISV